MSLTACVFVAGQMLSNFLFAARGTYAKIVMKENKMSGSDLFAINTIFAFLLMAPITFVMEGHGLSAGLSPPPV